MSSIILDLTNNICQQTSCLLPLHYGVVRLLMEPQSKKRYYQCKRVEQNGTALQASCTQCAMLQLVRSSAAGNYTWIPRLLLLFHCISAVSDLTFSGRRLKWPKYTYLCTKRYGWSGQSAYICALKGKVKVAKVHIFLHWKVRLKWPKYTYFCTKRYGWSGQSAYICALKGKVKVAKVHIFVHWKVRLKWPKYTYLCSRAFKRH
jgi:hypothetical protein